VRDSVWLRRLASAKLALWLIGALIVMNLLSVLVPQRIVLGPNFESFVSDYPMLAGLTEFVGLSTVFTGWPIVVVAVLLAVNVTACTLLRILRRRGVVPVPRAVRADRVVTLGGVGPKAGAAFLDGARTLLQSRRWQIVSEAPNGIVARAGRIGFWGSMLLHASLLVLIVGGALTAITAFKGEMAITDGESVVDAREAYINVVDMPRIGPAFTGARISLDATEVKYEQEQVVSAVARMRGVDATGRIVNKNVRVNHPLDVAGKSYLLLNSGYAIAITVDTSATGAAPRVVRLSEETPYGWRDSFPLPPTTDGRQAELRFLATPVALEEGQPMPVEKFALTDPHLRAKLVVGGEEVWEGRLKPGETQQLGPGIALGFDGMRLWDRFLVRSEPARWISYVGFWMAVIGAAVRFAFPERRFAVVVGVVDGHEVADVIYRVRPWSGFEARADKELERSLLQLATGSAPSGPDAESSPSETE